MADPCVLLVGETYHNSNLFYKTRFLSNNMMVYLSQNDSTSIICNSNDLNLAQQNTHVQNVYSYSHFNYVHHIKKLGHKDLAFLMMIKDILDHHSIQQVTVPKDFPAFFANGLMKMGYPLNISCELFVKERSIKTEDEILWVEEVQHACEYAMDRAETIIRESIVRFGMLYYQNNELTTDKLKRSIEIALLEKDCLVFTTIVSCGKSSANPHYFENEIIRANEPILIDIFPFHRHNRYYSDMTRTFSKGSPNLRIIHMHESVQHAHEEVLKHVREGVTASQLYQVACNSFNRDGYNTLREQKPTEAMMDKGFIHSIGHGIGLDLHEPPFLFSQDIPLCAGNIITIEPGLYDPQQGGVRIEDIILVTQDGYRLLSNYHNNLIIPIQDQ